MSCIALFILILVASLETEGWLKCSYAIHWSYICSNGYL